MHLLLAGIPGECGSIVRKSITVGDARREAAVPAAAELERQRGAYPLRRRAHNLGGACAARHFARAAVDIDAGVHEVEPSEGDGNASLRRGGVGHDGRDDRSKIYGDLWRKIG